MSGKSDPVHSIASHVKPFCDQFLPIDSCDSGWVNEVDDCILFSWTPDIPLECDLFSRNYCTCYRWQGILFVRDGLLTRSTGTEGAERH